MNLSLRLRPRGRHKGRSAPTVTEETTPVSDAARLALNLVREAADVFPPLKSVSGGVLAVWDLADRLSASDENATALM